MSIRSKLAIVNVAEADCALRRAGVGAAWRGLKQEAERAATPGRVLGVGLVAGFISGLRGRASAAGSPLGGKLMSMLMEGALASFSTAMAAGAAAAAAESAQSADAANNPGSGHGP